MENKKDSPGVRIPPPLLYAATFLLALFLEKRLPIHPHLLSDRGSRVVGGVLIAGAIVFIFPALRQFFLSKNTLITHRPANSLQATGIYRFSRNPMYTGTLFLYLGLSCMLGNCWNFILAPFLVLLVQSYVIRREERYLERRFGQAYQDYRSKVRRWL
ncbi:MAG: isoprenylcysteine carboxylmethyltransferase family protein [Flavobacteriales bacterium]|nr:isoprenylcysteine carboxylmethyltransferase family protein [Flavobacteriales bacterium]